MRRLIVSIFLAMALAAGAALPDSLHRVGNPSELRIHWRLRPHSHREARWGIVWNYRDSLHYDRAELVLADERYADVLGREAAELLITAVRHGRDSLVEKVAFSPASSARAGGLSLRMRLDPATRAATLEAGSARPQATATVDIIPGTKAGFYALSPADTLRMQFDCVERPVPEFAPFTDVGDLRARLAATTDVNECEWTYYDRNTNPQRVSLGGDYRLATVADGVGGYAIVLLGGAGDHAADWPPLRIKGHLRPTGFIGQYDLEWLDADGLSMGSDCSALITDGMLLELRFPLYGSSVRYRRVGSGQ